VADPSTQLKGVFNQTGEHAFLTLHDGSECTYFGKPFINKCEYDAAGELLQHLYNGGLVEPTDEIGDGLSVGEIVTFDQSPFVDEPYTLLMAALNDVGFLYVPDSCQNSSGPACGVHVAFHGCEQTVWDIGERFPLETGYNRWAAANNLIVLYPQARRTSLNPKGCWDWWGYTGLDFASKLGVQMQAVHRMMLSVA